MWWILGKPELPETLSQTKQGQTKQWKDTFGFSIWVTKVKVPLSTLPPSLLRHHWDKKCQWRTIKHNWIVAMDKAWGTAWSSTTDWIKFLLENPCNWGYRHPGYCDEPILIGVKSEEQNHVNCLAQTMIVLYPHPPSLPHFLYTIKTNFPLQQQDQRIIYYGCILS